MKVKSAYETKEYDGSWRNMAKPLKVAYRSAKLNTQDIEKIAIFLLYVFSSPK
jgi:hypothetical protein